MSRSSSVVYAVVLPSAYLAACGAPSEARDDSPPPASIHGEAVLFETAIATACLPGARECVGDQPEICRAGSFVPDRAACHGATPTCLDGACVACTPGTSRCAHEGVETCDTSGNWSRVIACERGDTCANGECAPVAAPRQLAPLSTSTVTSQTPLLHWLLAAGTTGARVDICRDRACTALVTSFVATGTSAPLPNALGKGVYFWRLHGVDGTKVGTLASPVWQFYVGARTATEANTSWGTVLDVNGDGFADLIVGAEAGGGPGTAYVYLGGPAGLAAVPATTLEGPGGAGSTFGYSVASAGDVNGDGFADAIVGARRDPNDEGVGVGGAYIYLGGAGGLSTTPTVKIVGQRDYFGSSVASAGDVNGDGYADILIGSPLDASAYLYLGSANVSGVWEAASIALILTGPASSSFGTSVASAGDLNGDGFGDVVIGAPDAENESGEAFVYLGSAAGLSTAAIQPEPKLPDGNFGFSVASAGDVNGDGFADLIVGLYEDEAACVYEGSATTVVAQGAFVSPVAVIGIDGPGPLANSYFGVSVAGAGDVNGDGYSDVVVAASGNNTAYVYEGSGSGLSLEVSTTIAAPGSPDEVVGANVAGVSDVNGDGFADVVVEAYQSNGGDGEADVHLGSATGVSSSPARVFVGATNTELGISAY